jgi:hypothetical protein
LRIKPKSLDVKTTGTNLSLLKEELDLNLKMTKQNTWPLILVERLSLHLNMVKALMEESNLPVVKSEDESLYQNVPYLFHQMIVNTYLGYFDRVKHLAEKYSSLSNDFKETFSPRRVYFAFYYALALLVTLKMKKKTQKLLSSQVQQLLAIVADASNLSEWNFKNKITLLLAEELSAICLVSSKSQTCSEYAEAGESNQLPSKAYHMISTHFHLALKQKPNTIWQLSCPSHLNLYTKKGFHVSLLVYTTREWATLLKHWFYSSRQRVAILSGEVQEKHVKWLKRSSSCADLFDILYIIY